MAMDIGKSISTAKASAERTPKIYEDENTEGVVTIVKASQFTTRKRDELLIFDLVVVSAQPKVAGAPCPLPGARRSIVFGMDEEGLGRAKSFVLRAIGAGEKDVSPEDLSDTVNAIFNQQALAGVKVGYDVHPYTKKNGEETFIVDWRNISGQTPEQVAAERKRLGI